MADSVAKLRILSAGAPKLGVRRCAETFARRTGHEVAIEFAPAPALRERLRDGTVDADILVAPVDMAEEFADSGIFVGGVGIVIGSVEAGIAVREGVPLPDITSVESLRELLLAADAIIYNTASSGQRIAALLTEIGVAELLKSKIERFATGAEVMVRVAKGMEPLAIAFGQIPEIRRFGGGGVTLVGPLPAEIAQTTTYAVVLMAGAIDSAKALLAYMDTAEARQIYAESGLA